MHLFRPHKKPQNISERLQERRTFIENILLPCLLFSTLTGIFTGALVFSFNLISTEVVHYSSEIYHFVRENPIYTPLLFLGVIVLGLLAGLMLKWFPNVRGGSLPVAVAHLRGHIAFKWLPNVVFVYFSSMISYLVGVPLGNEAPCVQMGAAVGKGTVGLFAKKHRAWRRYIMTGGACAGFAVTTGAPLSGIFFALEEAHRRFTPMVIMVATMSTSAAIFTSRWLCNLFQVELTIISATLESSLRLKDIWAVILLALVCALFAAIFSKTYEKINHIVQKLRQRLHFIIRLEIVFVIVAIFGMISGYFINDGHNLLHEILHNEHVWMFLLLYLFVRSILVICSNSVGATGGLFVPTLVFGAMLGSICAQILISIGALPAESAPIMIVIGMATYKGASMRTPITAIIFACEVLSGLTIETKEDMMTAAKQIGDGYHCAVLLKGGHSINDANDLLYNNGSFVWFESERIETPNTHGTGCTLSSAIASNLAIGFSLDESIRRAKDYISGALSAMLDLGKDSGPINHAYLITKMSTKQ